MILTIKEVAERLKIKEGTLYAWAAQGKIPSLKVHRLIRFRLEDVEQWLASCEKTARPPQRRRIRHHEAESVDRLIARAKRQAYNSAHGETTRQSSPDGKEDEHGAR